MDRPPPELAAPGDPPLALPPRASQPVAQGFPWLAAVAPLAGAAVLWAVTGLALSLVFAALGPLVAVASVVDARRQGRRARRRGAAERAALLAELRTAVADRHAEERAAHWRRVASARQIVEDVRPVEWRHGPPDRVVLGRGTIASGIRIDGVPHDDDDRALLRSAGALDDAPVLASVAGGIGVVGVEPVAGALARALVVQVAHAGRPDVVGIALPAGDAWAWSAALPHRSGPLAMRVVGGPDRGTETARARTTADADAVATIAVADAAEHLPHGLETVVRVSDHRRAVVERRGAAVPTLILPDLVGVAEASEWADRMRTAAAREQAGSGSGVPERVAFDALEQPSPDSSRTSLRVVVGMAADGPLALDLVEHGPHAIVAGTTGSGKSEFLVAWLAALATRHPPDRVAFLLVDFKGGAAFEPLRGLPHVTGIVTDLDEAEAERAVLSLRAELRHREAVLLAEGVRDLAALPDRAVLPRLVLVVDEYPAMVERFPDLGPVVADVAARGRSLGVHLVLASQRPNGVVREQVSANCAIRVSLRVRQRSDSVAVVGSEAAAAIRPDRPGRGIVDLGDRCPVEFQSALVDPGSLERLQRSTSTLARARRPWMDPLPARLTPSVLAELVAADGAVAEGARTRGHGLGLPFGVLDDPERQRHVPAVWTPEADGHLLVVGEPGSGRTTALAAIARAAKASSFEMRRVAGPPSARWDALQVLALDDRRGASSRRVLLLVDDLDVAFRDWPDEHRVAAVGILERLLREGRERGLAVAASAGSAHRLPAGLRELLGSAVLLRHPTRTDLAQAGGATALWRAGDPPGSGQWRERRLQVVDVPPLPAEPGVEPPILRFGTTRLTAVVSARPRADAATLGRLGRLGLAPVLLEPGLDATVRAAIGAVAVGGAGHPLVVVGDADAWAANWTVAALVREEAVIVVHGGSREFRVFSRGSSPAPLLDDPVAQCWLVPPGGEPTRCVWPVHVDN